MKKNIITVFSIFFVAMILLLGCDDGLRYVKMEIKSLPDKTVYYCGKDQVLDFTGGAVVLETYDGRQEIVPMQKYTYQSWSGGAKKNVESYISSDIDFATPGEYTVTIWQHKELYCQFNVFLLQSAGQKQTGQHGQTLWTED